MAESLEALFSKFSKIDRAERLGRLKKMARLNDEDLNVLEGKNAFDLNLAENFIENVVGYFPIPLGIATNFRIDGRDIPIPMAVEETSIIASASGTAKWINQQEGKITTKSSGRNIIGQIQFPALKNPQNVQAIISDRSQELIHLANLAVPGLVSRGGGVNSLSVRVVDRPDGDKMLVLHVYCDPCDAMGANLINQICETLKPHLEAWTLEKVGLCILSNLVDSKLTIAEVEIPGLEPELGQGIAEAALFAELDPYRAATHNKGVLNGIDPIIIATGNDWRAVEAGVHAYATRNGKYQPITHWNFENGILRGRFEAPIVVGSVGGVTKLHPTAQVCLRILGTQKAEELSRIMAAVGLVQNLGALKALSTVGIVKGHMNLHAANIALAAGASNAEMPHFKEKLMLIISQEKKLTLSRAKEVLAKLRGAPLGPQ